MTSPTISSHSSLAASYQFVSDHNIPSLLFQMKTLPHNHKYYSNINLLQSPLSFNHQSPNQTIPPPHHDEDHDHLEASSHHDPHSSSPLPSHSYSSSYSSFDFYPNQVNPLELLKTHPSLIYRLHLAKVIDDPHLGHSGCVNSVAWIPPEDYFHSASLGASHYLGNEDTGNLDSLLISGSDDCCIKIWNSHSSECKWNISTPHTGNIFCVKFFPHCNLDRIISSAADSKICIYEQGKHIRTIKEHTGMVHRVCIENSSPNVFISISQDGYVKLFDLRQPNHEHVNLLHLQSGGTGGGSRLVRFSGSSATSIDINSIDMNPRNCNEIILGCDDPFVRLFDRRKIVSSSSSNSRRDQVIDASTVQKYCPSGLLPSDESTRRPHPIPLHVTGVRFNKYGDEIVATYSGDHIYLFDKSVTSSTIAADAKMSYIGHCNVRTVKEVNFFGECSEYILSGSDCGNVFVWDKKTGCIINVIKGDDHVVNCLAPHPIYPGVLATSGIEHNIKLFELGVLDYFDDNPETSCYEKNMAYRDANKVSLESPTMADDEEHHHAMSTSSSSSSTRQEERSKHDRVSRLISENERKTREGHSSLILPASMVFNLMQLLASQSDEDEEENNATGGTSTTNNTQQQQQRRRRRAQEIFQLLEELGGRASSEDEEEEENQEEEEPHVTTRSCRTM
ncbi:hypothetical protein FDP41_010521 [Naegleria fowleri]|uniref:Uncharacterized protein n=1 Tax=Naegleria fowleri TaxID=5763 RepID=A0A6A5C6S3_NAEFO|nr:uncharacterized protein FDP41_010521 [Naegleria fowleri]KAF0983456.1 hypothetical protein FDP41_010521 [Naegleria fowleri]